MWVETINKAELNNEVQQITADLTQEEKREIANKAKLPTVTVSEKKANQESGVAEKIPEDQANNMRMFVEKYGKNPKFEKIIQSIIIDGGANGEKFIPFWPKQRELENTITNVTKSLSEKGYNRKLFLEQKWLVVPTDISTPNSQFLDAQLKNNLNEEQQSDLLNKWLSAARALQMLDVFNRDQIQTLVSNPKFTIKVEPYKEIKNELKFASFNVLTNSEMLKRNPLPWEVKFKFSEISSVQSGTEGGEYNPDALKVNQYSIWSISNKKIIDPVTKEEKYSINRSNTNSTTTTPDPVVGQWIWTTALKTIIGPYQSKAFSSWTYTKDLYTNMENFSPYVINKNDNIQKQIINGNERTERNWPLYEVNILANKIGPDHRLNNYFDIKREKNTISWRDKIVSITMKNSLRSGDVNKDYQTSLDIINKIYQEQGIVDENFNTFFMKNKEHIQNDNDYKNLLATGFVK